MPDEYGAFTATVCAFDGSNTQLGCASFNASTDDPQAAFMGIYDDTQEISKVTVDAGGALYPHDFAIGDLYVVNGEKQLASVPASVTVPAGQTTATFPVTSNPVSQATSLTISGDYNGIQTATLTLTTPDLAFLIMNPASVPEGTSSTGTVTLANPAPSGGATVTLTSDVPAVQAHVIQSVTALAGLQADGSIAWSSLGAPNTSIASGTVEPVSGISGLSVTLSNSANQPLEYGTQCPADNCSWAGNFAPGANLLWDGGTYQGNNWVGNGPMTLAFSSPQRGVGFQMMPDEYGTFTATVCAFDGSNTQLGCASQRQHGHCPGGIYRHLRRHAGDLQGYRGRRRGAASHDFAIGDLYVVNGARPVTAVVPASVTVPQGQTTATFPVTTNQVRTTIFVTITGTYDGTHTSGTMQVTAPALSSVSLSPASLIGGNASTATVTLNSAAQSGGAVITLSSNNAAATVPASVTVAATATSATFSVGTSAVVSSTPVTITGTYNGVQQAATLTINPAPVVVSVTSVAVDPTSVLGGDVSTGTVTLSAAAPSGGSVVALESSDPAVTVPGSVTVGAGATTATFTASTTAVVISTTSTIKATLIAEATTQLTVLPPAPLTLSSVSLAPTSVTGGDSRPAR